MAKQFVHVLIAASYSSEVPIPSKILGDCVTDRLIRTEELHKVMTYQMGYDVDPISCGLKDAWNRMDDYEREMFSEGYPQLATAISLMCGGDDGASREATGTETGSVSGQDGTNRS